MELYCDEAIWSQRFKAWRKYRVKRPRARTDEDTSIRWVDAPLNKPVSLSMMQGTHNNEVITAMNNLRESFDASKDLPPSIILCGPSGSGKTTIGQKFIHDLCDDVRIQSAYLPKFFLETDANKFSNFAMLWSRISKFAEPALERFIPTSFRIIMVDNADLIPPSQQQTLKKLMEVFDKRVRWVFICTESKKLITHIQSLSLCFLTHCISEKNALIVVLSLCHRSRIGYDREGIRAVFHLLKTPEAPSLSKLIDNLQKVFLQTGYISDENVARVAGSAKEKHKISAATAMEPLSRCPVCTLIPPCKHTTEAMLTETGIVRRAELPRNKGATQCPEFVRFGHCALFNKYGRCPMDHPKDLHSVVKPIKRCNQCTIPWPCHHCAYSPKRDHLMKTIKEVQTRLHLLKQLVVPDPMINIAGFLNELYPSWKVLMSRYGEIYLTKQKEEALNATIQWEATSYCQVAEEYRMKERLLRLAFQDMLDTPMLDAVALRKAARGDMGASTEEGGEGGEDADMDMHSSVAASEAHSAGGSHGH